VAKRQRRGLRKTNKSTPVGDDDPQALFDHAATLHERGALGEAEALCRRILIQHPTHAWALNLMGVIHCQTERSADGIKLLATALQQDPNEATFYNNFGTGLTGLGRHGDAVTAFSRALELNPDYAAAHNNIGAPLKALGQPDSAAEHYRASVRIRPDFGEAWANLANVLLDLGHIDDAEAAALKAIRHAPDYPAAHNNLGTILHRRARYDDAEMALRRALELQPDYPDALCNLGEVLKESGRAAEAMAAYDQACALAPDEPDKGSNLLFALCCLDDATPASIAARHRRWGTSISQGAADFSNHDRSANRRLKIGYVSSDFRRHSVAYFLEPILEHHDKSAFEVFAYANMLGGDEVTQRLRGHVDHWRDVLGLDDPQLAAQVRADNIDILIDLAGHTRGNRLTAFALNPAPVQITYLGYPATTGLSAINARLSDPWADPPGMTEAFHSEQLIRLEHGFLCYRPPDDAPDIAPLPADDAGHITFGSFNNLAKVTPATIARWAEILHAVPNAKLRLKAKALGDDTTRQSIIQRFATHDIGEHQLELMAWIVGASPLTAYHGVDIGLDTFPYHGTTTTMEALWMGVPVVTLAGEWHASRVGVSIMARCKLDELIAANPDDYVKIATNMAGNLPLLRNLRQQLRGLLVRGGLTDGIGFTAELEVAYRQAWAGWAE
jgi:protein O-GlcNAc transferase